MVKLNSAAVGYFSLLLSSILLVPLAVAQTRPNPPSLCIAGSDSCEAAPTSPPPSTGVKWHPGHYVKTQGQHCDTDQSEYYSGIQSNLNNHVTSSDEIRGAYVIYPWGALEIDKGVYDWSRIRDNLNWLAGRGKYLLAGIEVKCYGGASSPEWLAPKDLEAEVERHNGATAGIIALWRPEVMDRFITFMQAFAREFDDHPNLEMVSFVPELCTAFGGIDAPSDYSTGAYATQLYRLYKAEAAAFNRTAATGPINCSLGGEVVNLMEAAYQAGLGAANPDTHEEASKIFKGEASCGGSCEAIRDYRGMVPYRTIVSAPNLGGKDDILPLSNVQAILSDAHVTHVAWVMTSSSSGGSKSDIIKHIESNSTLYDGCPSVFESCN